MTAVAHEMARDAALALTMFSPARRPITTVMKAARGKGAARAGMKRASASAKPAAIPPQASTQLSHRNTPAMKPAAGPKAVST